MRIRFALRGAALALVLLIHAGAVILPFPEAAVDVDTVDDWKFVQALVKKQHS